MKTNRPQMILVAILVCLFAVGMAGLLNFFKYRSIVERIVQDGTDSAATNLLKNSFGLAIGHVVVRYSDDQLKATSNAVAGTLALQALLVFLAAATLASFALLGVLNRLSRHVDTVAAALG